MDIFLWNEGTHNEEEECRHLVPLLDHLPEEDEGLKPGCQRRVLWPLERLTSLLPPMIRAAKNARTNAASFIVASNGKRLSTPNFS